MGCPATELPRSTQILPGLEFEQDPVVIGHQGAADGARQCYRCMDKTAGRNYWA